VTLLGRPIGRALLYGALWLNRTRLGPVGRWASLLRQVAFSITLRRRGTGLPTTVPRSPSPGPCAPPALVPPSGSSEASARLVWLQPGLGEAAWALSLAIANLYMLSLRLAWLQPVLKSLRLVWLQPGLGEAAWALSLAIAKLCARSLRLVWLQPGPMSLRLVRLQPGLGEAARALSLAIAKLYVRSLRLVR